MVDWNGGMDWNGMVDWNGGMDWNGMVEWTGMVDWNGMVEWNGTLVISIGGHLFIRPPSNKDHLFIKTVLL